MWLLNSRPHWTIIIQESVENENISDKIGCFPYIVVECTIRMEKRRNKQNPGGRSRMLKSMISKEFDTFFGKSTYALSVKTPQQ